MATETSWLRQRASRIWPPLDGKLHRRMRELCDHHEQAKRRLAAARRVLAAYDAAAITADAHDLPSRAAYQEAARLLRTALDTP
jgi:hypothetical protein